MMIIKIKNILGTVERRRRNYRKLDNPDDYYKTTIGVIRVAVEPVN